MKRFWSGATPRCSTSRSTRRRVHTHALASICAPDAIKVEIPKNATYIRNLVPGCSCTTVHLPSARLDFVDVTSALQADPVGPPKSFCFSRPASADGFKAAG
ncbi:MAG: nickel-dependent hydrogenase large subunit [Bilophila wadsworthia]